MILREARRRARPTSGPAPAQVAARPAAKSALEQAGTRRAPPVARAIVLKLRERVRDASNIPAAAMSIFDTSVNTIFPVY